MTTNIAPPDGFLDADPGSATVASPAPVNLVAAVAGIAVLAVGIAGQLTHTGLFFLPALVVLAVAAVKLGRERSQAREKASR